MASERDGESKETTRRRKSVSVSSESGGCSSSPVENIEQGLPGTPFRGFAKVPSVSLLRYDITPYLKTPETMNESHETASNNRAQLDSPSPTIDIRLFNCQVKMTRDDLEHLKETACTPERLYTCKICSKKYPDIKKLRNHHDNKHLIVYGPLKPPKRVSFSDKVIVHELREYHECRKCTKIFESYVLLKRHMKENHKKRKCYICNYCNKKFVDRTIFKVHIKLHCDICGDLSPTKTKFTEHRRYVCKVYKLHKCSTCDAVFFNFLDLKDHSYEHGDVLVCDVCKDQFGTKCAIAHHIMFLHSKQRPTTLYEMRLLGSDRLYLCNFCDESSVEKSSIEHHVNLLPDLSNRAMTGYKDYYFCDHCFKKFDKESEMLQHKWTHFLIEPDVTTETNSAETSATEVKEPKKIKSALKKVRSDTKIIELADTESSLDSETQTPDSTETVQASGPIIFDLTKEVPPIMLPKVVVKRLSTEQIEKTIKPNKNNTSILLNYLTDDNGTESHGTNNNGDQGTTSNGTDGTEIIKSNKKNNQEKEGSAAKNAHEGKKKKAVVVNSKTIMSKHQCEICLKYFSNAYCLRRHLDQIHRDFENLRCRDCEETFVWPSLLLSHNCLRTHLPDENYDDASPEILFDNIPRISTDSYQNCVDFEIPAEPVNSAGTSGMVNGGSGMVNGGRGMVNGGSEMGNDGNEMVNSDSNKFVARHPKGYQILVQEVPIEF